MRNGRKGSSIGEYMIILVLIAVVAMGGTYAYQKFFVKKSFETTIQSIEKGENISGEFVEDKTETFDKVKLAAPMFLAFFSVLIFIMIIFSTLSAAKKSKKRLRDLGDDEDGQALTEFILIFPLQLFITLCIMQLSLLYSAKLVVNYAAFNAARAAVVVIPQSMEDEITGQINLPKNEEDNNSENNNSEEDDKKLKKFKLIKKAAALSLMPICQGSKAFLDGFKITVIGGHTYSAMDIIETLQIDELINFFSNFVGYMGDIFGVDDLDKYTQAVVYRYMYASLFTNIEILDTNMDVQYDEKTYTRSDVVVVKVKFPYYMIIPIANKFMGKKFNEDLFNSLGLSSSTQETLGYLDNDYFSILKVESDGYVYPITAECAMHVEMKASH